MQDASAELVDRLAEAQACLAALTKNGADEGLDTEIYTHIEDGKTAYRICLVRRIYSPIPTPPTLKVIS